MTKEEIKNFLLCASWTPEELAIVLIDHSKAFDDMAGKVLLEGRVIRWDEKFATYVATLRLLARQAEAMSAAAARAAHVLSTMERLDIGGVVYQVKSIDMPTFQAIIGAAKGKDADTQTAEIIAGIRTVFVTPPPMLPETLPADPAERLQLTQQATAIIRAVRVGIEEEGIDAAERSDAECRRQLRQAMGEPEPANTEAAA